MGNGGGLVVVNGGGSVVGNRFPVLVSSRNMH